jgi:hypothetical protein
MGYLANPYSTFEGWFTLFTLPFTLFEVLISLSKEDSPFKKSERTHPWGWIALLKGDWRVNHPFWLSTFFIHPLKRVIHPSITLFQITLIEGWMRSPFLKGKSIFERLITTSKRVNGRVNRMNHPSKVEWGFHFSQNMYHFK